MKKIILSLVVSLLLVPVAQAAMVLSDYGNRIAQNYTQVIAPINFIAEADNEITAEFGMNLLVDPYLYILWSDEETITASGTAVDEGRLDAEVTPVYSNDKKSVYIPINSDLMNGEVITLTGLAMRGYDRDFSNRYLGLDINGDLITDFSDLSGYKVDSDIRTDQTIPYPVYDVDYEINEAMTELTITWTNPPDYDLVSHNVERVITRDGQTSLMQLILDGVYSDTFRDEDVQEGDEITYYIYARDRRNVGEAYELFAVVEPAPIEEPVEEPVEEPIVEPVVEETELEELDRLLNYYGIRYSIKCMPSGVAVPTNDSACLWARIDLIYAQELLGVSNIDTSLTDFDIHLMTIRRQYPEARYLDNCKGGP